MDVSDITKVATRKRISEDAEKLRNKISRETAKIIKLKVAQDTAYWDLKEKLQQLESNHERLQQNMIEVQMQYETISGQYQDELRLRPETINKLSGTREICDVLEEYGARLKGGVARAAADRDALALATRAAAHRAAALRLAAERALHAHAHRALATRARLRLAEAQQAAAARELQAARSAHGAAAAEARAALAAETERRERALADAERLAAQLHRRTGDLERKDRVIADMQKETQRLVSEFNVRSAALEETIAKQDVEWRAAESRQREAETRATEAERRGAEAERELERLRTALMEEQASVERLGRSAAALAHDKEQLEQRAAAQQQAAQDAAARAQQLHERAAALDEQRRALDAALADERRRGADVRAQLAAAEAQLAAASDTIARLMRDVQAEADARHRLEAAAKAKDEELARQLALMLDMKNEHQRLRDKIAGMQATIDNIQKELTGRAPGGGPRRTQPERLRPDAPPPDRMLYNFLSDASADTEGLESPLSLSQVKSDLSSKHRTFFKSKKFDAKLRKANK